MRRLLACYFLAVGAFSAMEATFAFLMKDRYALSDSMVPWVFTYIGVLVTVVQGGLVGPLTRRLGEKRLLVIGMALQAVALLALPFSTGMVGLLLATAPLAVGNGLSSPALAALISRHSPADEQGGTLGIGQSAAAFGRILGPTSGTFSFQRDFSYPYVGGAAIMVLASLIGATVQGSATLQGAAVQGARPGDA
jgi:MFS family permease